MHMKTLKLEKEMAAQQVRDNRLHPYMIHH